MPSHLVGPICLTNALYAHFPDHCHSLCVYVSVYMDLLGN